MGFVAKDISKITNGEALGSEVTSKLVIHPLAIYSPDVQHAKSIGAQIVIDGTPTAEFYKQLGSEVLGSNVENTDPQFIYEASQALGIDVTQAANDKSFAMEETAQIIEFPTKKKDDIAPTVTQESVPSLEIIGPVGEIPPAHSSPIRPTQPRSNYGTQPTSLDSTLISGPASYARHYGGLARDIFSYHQGFVDNARQGLALGMARRTQYGGYVPRYFNR